MKACAEAIGLDVPEFVLPTDHTAHLNGIDFHYLDWATPTSRRSFCCTADR